MRRAHRVVFAIAISAPPVAIACLGSGGDALAPPPSSGGAKAEGGAAIDGSRDGARDGGGRDAMMPPPTTSTTVGLRVANWSAGTPAVDFCIAPLVAPGVPGPFQGPVMATNAADAGALSFPKVSAYQTLPPGEYFVRMVLGAPGVGCSIKGLIVPDDFDTGAALKTAGTNATAALIGPSAVQPAGSDPALKIVQLPDTVAGPLPKEEVDGAFDNQFAVRFFNGATALGPADLGAVGNGTFTPLLTGAGFGLLNARKDGGSYDPNGYQSIKPLWAQTTVRAQASATPRDAGSGPMPDPNVTTAPGEVVTMAVLGIASDGGSLQLLQCVDNAGTTTPYSLCTTISVSTCGNGALDPFEQCDCGNDFAGTPQDPRCIDPVTGTPEHNCSPIDDMCPHFCTALCTVNPFVVPPP